MSSPTDQLIALRQQRDQAALRIQTLGDFRVWRRDDPIPDTAWGRDKTMQLFQFLLAARHRHGLHKEQIIDRIWEDVDGRAGDQSFKVALHGVNKALEPDRPKRTEPRFVRRQGLTYQLDLSDIWLDIDALEAYIALGNRLLPEHPTEATYAYQEALSLYQGTFLPNRIYEDWSSEERERIQVLTLNTYITLGELLLTANPLESIRLAQNALLLDNSWEDAYRLMMEAYLQKGNRPMVIKTYRQCVAVLEDAFGIEPLPETKAVYAAAMDK